jgi:hypothetical protein
MLALARGLFFSTRTSTTFLALPTGWQISQVSLQFLSPALDRFFVQTGDFGQLTITGTTWSL